VSDAICSFACCLLLVSRNVNLYLVEVLQDSDDDDDGGDARGGRTKTLEKRWVLGDELITGGW
jgi:hypothetical protein